jgi:hypothetical protein
MAAIHATSLPVLSSSVGLVVHMTGALGLSGGIDQLASARGAQRAETEETQRAAPREAPLCHGSGQIVESLPVHGPSFVVVTV